MKQKKVALFISCCMLFGLVKSQQAKFANRITLQNKSVVDYFNKVVEIPWEQAKNLVADTANLKIIDAQTKKEIIYQFEYAGKPGIQNLLVQVTLHKKSTMQLLLIKQKHAIFIIKTYGRYVPERKEDFAWENDKIAYRMYGKELESTPAENAYGIDVWVKRNESHDS